MLALELGLESGEAVVAWLVDNFWTGDEMAESSVDRPALLQHVRQNFASIEQRDMAEQADLMLMLGGFLKVVETESGDLGMAPKGCKPGDVVCLLIGLGFPVGLRKNEGGEHYQHVGPCFVPSLVGGPAAWQKMGMPALEEFVLC